ncbi:hypothetical protein [Luteimonas sp. A478]
METASPVAPEQSQEEGLRQQVIADFEASLRESSSLDDGDLDGLLETFRQAVEDTPLDVALTPFDPEDLTLALNGLVDNGVLAEDERNDLSRQIDDALGPLQTPDVQMAMEFASRCERDGEEAALEWFQNERRRSEESGQEDVAPADVSGMPGRDSIVNSKSRRLRGPPRR